MGDDDEPQRVTNSLLSWNFTKAELNHSANVAAVPRLAADVAKVWKCNFSNFCHTAPRSNSANRAKIEIWKSNWTHETFKSWLVAGNTLIKRMVKIHRKPCELRCSQGTLDFFAALCCLCAPTNTSQMATNPPNYKEERKEEDPTKVAAKA